MKKIRIRIAFPNGTKIVYLFPAIPVESQGEITYGPSLPECIMNFPEIKSHVKVGYLIIDLFDDIEMKETLVTNKN